MTEGYNKIDYYEHSTIFDFKGMANWEKQERRRWVYLDVVEYCFIVNTIVGFSRSEGLIKSR